MKLKTIINIVAIAFLCFILFVILSANMGWNFFFFKYGKALPFEDKMAHFLLVGVLTFFVNLLLSIKRIEFFKRKFLLGSILVFAFITVEEFSQIFLTRRNFDLLDLTANYLGIFIFGNLAYWICSQYNILEKRFW